MFSKTLQEDLQDLLQGEVDSLQAPRLFFSSLFSITNIAFVIIFIFIIIIVIRERLIPSRYLDILLDEGDDGDDNGGDDANDDDGEWQNGVLSTHNQRKFCCKLPTGYWRELYNGLSSTFIFTL